VERAHHHAHQVRRPAGPAMAVSDVPAGLRACMPTRVRAHSRLTTACRCRAPHTTATQPVRLAVVGAVCAAQGGARGGHRRRRRQAGRGGRRLCGVLQVRAGAAGAACGGSSATGWGLRGARKRRPPHGAHSLGWTWSLFYGLVCVCVSHRAQASVTATAALAAHSTLCCAVPTLTHTHTHTTCVG
jgi:hypothetical protein